MLTSPAARLLLGGAALAVGFVLGLQAMPSGDSVSEASVAETIRPKSLEPSASLRPQIQDHPGFQLASLESETISLPAASDSDRQVEFTMSIRRRASEDPAVGGRVASFEERFAGAIDWPYTRQGPEERESDLLLPAPDVGARPPRSQPARVASLSPTLPPSILKKPNHVADAVEDSTAQPDDDEHTAIYDIVARKVYLPNGRILEAHSGLGGHIDDPRYVSERDRGPTPPNIYDLSMREELFHGVRALRLTPIGSGNMYGRAGLLAHSYMLGPNGQSNGCVSFSDYPAFLNAYLNGEVTRLVVVDHLANPPSVKTAAGWIPRALSVLFGRS